METDRQQIEDRAAAFLQRRDTGPWTPEDEAELSQWLDAATGHRVAYLRTEAAWEAMGRLKALGAGLPHREVPAPDVIGAAVSPSLLEMSQVIRRSTQSGRPGRSHFYKLGAAAAGVLVVVLFGLWGYQSWVQGERYATPVGGMASVPLEDGSQIILNTGSKVNVVLSQNERHVDLAQGEAFFEVAKDPKRPFVVQANHTKIIAVGTQFSVRRASDDKVELIVTEGKVRVEGSDQMSAAAAAQTGTPSGHQAFVSAGEIAQIGSHGFEVREEPPPQAEDALAWREGFLVFRDTSLAEAVAEFNRYSARLIVVSDPAVARMPLTGKFKATNSEAFIALLEQTFRIQAQSRGSTVVLTRGDPK